MYRYTVMAVSTALFFAVIYVLLDLISGSAIDWGGIAFEAVAFGAIMTGIQYYKERNNKK
ncbi:MAG: hypothetical protein IJ710_04130 [Prevotella sp.]|nr:hypothetical protein [Prevotella sp.]